MAGRLFRVEDGVIIDPDGNRLSTISIIASADTASAIDFSPGIEFQHRANKTLTVTGGTIRFGEAYERNGLPHLVVNGASTYELVRGTCS